MSVVFLLITQIDSDDTSVRVKRWGKKRGGRCEGGGCCGGGRDTGWIGEID